MDRAKIFQSVIKGTNVFTPIIDSYHTVGNHIIELSCSEKDNQHGLYNREVNGITFYKAIAKRRKRNKNKKTHRR